MFTRDFVTIIVAIVVVLFVYAIYHDISRNTQLKRYERIQIGMPESEMLSIMGKGYNKSSLTNGKYKYEWRINGISYGSHGFRSYSGVRKVDIYTRNNSVIEIRPYNV